MDVTEIVMARGDDGAFIVTGEARLRMRALDLRGMLGELDLLRREVQSLAATIDELRLQVPAEKQARRKGGRS